ncbi:hypothetical protein EVAR_5035_1 [Eumeta japonica]|uniref:Uncharacterized protein n=1 Tax=Eumeta variegata TaxID=151549 RepID=A0A4C1SXE1_EUMVA|nr:hypothetical protein EVAR_5035_1 [Eumeta japonica]
MIEKISEKPAYCNRPRIQRRTGLGHLQPGRTVQRSISGGRFYERWGPPAAPQFDHPAYYIYTAMPDVVSYCRPLLSSESPNMRWKKLICN